MEAEVRRAFITAKYSADRAHELELEKATGQFEFAYLRGLLLLNGASATAFVSVVASGFRGVVRHAPCLFLGALITWLLGMLLAVYAGQIAYRAQKHFADRLRFRRHAMGIGVLGENNALILGTADSETVPHMLEMAAEARGRGDATWQLAEQIGWISVSLFVIGVIAAAAAVLRAG